MIIRIAERAINRYRLLTACGWWLFTLLAVLAPILALQALSDWGTNSVVVIKADRIAPFAPLTDQDIETKRTASHPGALTDPKEVTGRLATRELNKGDLLDDTVLTPRNRARAGSETHTLSLVIKPISKTLSASLPQRVTLFGTPKTGQTTTFEKIVLLLAIEDALATIALSDPDWDALAPALPVCDFTVVLGAPRVIPPPQTKAPAKASHPHGK